MVLAFVYSAVSFAFRPVVYATFTYTVHVDLNWRKIVQRPGNTSMRSARFPKMFYRKASFAAHEVK